MDFRSSDTHHRARAPRTSCRTTATAAVKIVIVGGFGVGKTTMVGSVSEIRPLTTEETMTQAGVGVDDIAGVETQDRHHRRHGLRPDQHQRASWCSTCSAPPARSASGSCGTACSKARSAPSSWSTPAGWRSASTSSAGWRSAACPSSSPSTPSPTRPRHPVEDLRSALDLPDDGPDRRLRRPAPGLQPRRPDDPDALPALPGHVADAPAAPAVARPPADSAESPSTSVSERSP